jgi:hypothetical protein
MAPLVVMRRRAFLNSRYPQNVAAPRIVPVLHQGVLNR